MAKQRKSIFNADTTKEDLQKEAKAIEKKVLSGPKEKRKDERPKHLYVDSEHHQKAKLQAVQMGMKLNEYVEWLIDGHQP